MSGHFHVFKIPVALMTTCAQSWYLSPLTVIFESNIPNSSILIPDSLRNHGTEIHTVFEIMSLSKSLEVLSNFGSIGEIVAPIGIGIE